MKNLRFRPTSRFISETIQATALLRLKTNGNSYAIYRIVPFPTTFSDL